jgi:cytochrome P450
MYNLVCAFLAVCFFIRFVWLQWSWYKVNKLLPGPPRLPGLASLFLGHICDILALPKVENTEEHDLLLWWRELMSQFVEYGFFRVNFFPWTPLRHTVLVVFDPDTVNEMLSRKTHNSFVKGFNYQLSKPLIGGGLLSSHGGVWHRQRSITERGFRLSTLESTASVSEQIVSALIKRWDRMRKGSGEDFIEIDASKEALKLTMDVLGRVGFSFDFNSVSAERDADAPLYDAFNIILKELTIRARGGLWRPWVPLPATIRFNAAMAKLDAKVDAIIAERVLAIEGGDNDHDDLLQSLLQGENSGTTSTSASSDKKKTFLSHTEVRDNIKTFLFAGHDTTASAITWALYFLAANKGAEQRLLAELHDEFGLIRDDHFSGSPNDCSGSLEAASEAAFTFRRVDSLPYLAAVVKETLRIYPSAGFTREFVGSGDGKGFNINGFSIPAGCEIMVLPYLLHRHPKHAPADMEEFLPERWIDPERIEETKALAYLPFSAGPRSCIGQRMATVEIKMALALLLRRYRFEAVGSIPKARILLTLTPNEVRLRLTPRR